MTWTISRDYWFSAAHRLEGHPKCGRLHGHNYKVVVLLQSMVLDETDQWIMDYGQLDKVVKPIIEEMDHRYIVSMENVQTECPYYVAARERAPSHLVMPGIERSTAEELAWWFWKQTDSALKLLGFGHVTVEIFVCETEKSVASYSTRDMML